MSITLTEVHYVTIPSHPKYAINIYGEVKNKETGHIKSKNIGTTGYYMIGLYHSKKVKLHRLLAEVFIANPENKPEVNHKDGNKLNNSLSNLEWVTASENRKHAWATGLHPITDNMIKNCQKMCKSLRKLSVQQILEIRAFSKCGISNRKIAKMYNVSSGTINNIINNKNYMEVK